MLTKEISIIFVAAIGFSPNGIGIDAATSNEKINVVQNTTPILLVDG